MKWMLLLLVVALGTPHPLSAQGSLPVEAGARLRVLYSFPEARDRHVVGSLIESDSTVLRLRQDQVIQPLLWGRVRSVQVSINPGFPQAETIGAVIGGVLGHSLYSEYAEQNEWSNAEAALLGVPAGAVAGYLIGRLLGAEKWRTVGKSSFPNRSGKPALETDGP